MKKLKLTKIIASSLIAVSVLALNPIGASAEWKQNSTGWWYTEGNSWATGWKQIDGKWYYFYSNGYMARNTMIGTYQLGSDGAWTNSIITLDAAKQIALDKVKTVLYPNGSGNSKIIIIPYSDIGEEVIEGRSGYLITIGEDNYEHTVPTARVFVDKHTGEVFDAFDVVFGIGNKKLKELK